MANDVSEVADRKAAFWAKFYEEYFKRLCALARCLLTDGNLAEAEDVVSEAFLRVIHYVKNPEAIANLPGYLWITVKRVFIAKRRKEHSAQMESLDDLLSAGQHPTVEPQVLRILENEELLNALSANKGPLTSREEQLLTLHLQGLSCDEIATVLGEDVRLTSVDLNAVKAKVRYRLTRAKAKIKDKIRPNRK
jgi:RNA polymerase sigma factor (sigma-70 family)